MFGRDDLLLDSVFWPARGEANVPAAIAPDNWRNLRRGILLIFNTFVMSDKSLGTQPLLNHAIAEMIMARPDFYGHGVAFLKAPERSNFLYFP